MEQNTDQSGAPVKGAFLDKQGKVVLCQDGKEEVCFGFASRLYANQGGAAVRAICREKFEAFVNTLPDGMKKNIDDAKERGESLTETAFSIGFESGQGAAVRGEAVALPTNDEIYAEVCKARGNANLYVSTNAVNDTMAAVRRLLSARAADALDSHPTDNGKFLCAMEFEAVELGYTGLAEAMAALRRMKAEPDAGREALIACLGDDAATLSHINPDDEMAQTMRDAIAMLESDEVVIATLGMSSSQPTEPVADVQARVRDAVAENLRGLYYCGRVWSAWSYGTMSESDFAPAEEDDDVVTNITDAVMATIAPASSQPTEGDGCDECRHTYCLSGEICRHCGDVNGTQGWKGGLQPTDGGVRNG